MSGQTESSRIEAFRRELIASIPRIPNDRASLELVQALSLSGLLMAYINWRLRFVGQRPRQVLGSSKLETDHRSLRLKENIAAFLGEVEAGNDLTPYLSDRAMKRGYAPGAYGSRPSVDQSEDKDLILYSMGLHHFHLGLGRHKGLQDRTNEVLLAFVNRDHFEILGLFDHRVFEHANDGALSDERQRLWDLYDAHLSRNTPDDGFLMGGLGGLGITTAGTPTVGTSAAIRHARIIREIDARLDDLVFVRQLYREAAQPARPKLAWHYRNLDLGLLDRKAGFFGVFEYGPT